MVEASVRARSVAADTTREILCSLRESFALTLSCDSAVRWIALRRSHEKLHAPSARISDYRHRAGPTATDRALTLTSTI